MYFEQIAHFPTQQTDSYWVMSNTLKRQIKLKKYNSLERNLLISKAVFADKETCSVRNFTGIGKISRKINKRNEMNLNIHRDNSANILASFHLYKNLVYSKKSRYLRKINVCNLKAFLLWKSNFDNLFFNFIWLVNIGIYQK